MGKSTHVLKQADAFHDLPHLLCLRAFLVLHVDVQVTRHDQLTVLCSQCFQEDDLSSLLFTATVRSVGWPFWLTATLCP